MKERKRIKLVGIWQYLIHYVLSVLALIVPILSIQSLYEMHIGTYNGILTVDDIIKESIPFLVIATVSYIFRWRLLYFKEINITCSNKDFKEAVQRTIYELDVLVEYNKDNKFKGTFSKFWLDGWVIAIEKEGDTIYFNSISDPDKMPGSSLFGPRKHRKIFLSHLNDVLASVPRKKTDEKIGKEWSFKRILMRLFLYPVSFLFFYIGIGLMIQESFSLYSVFLALAFMLIAGVCIYFDISSIVVYNKIKRKEKRKKESGA